MTFLLIVALAAVQESPQTTTDTAVVVQGVVGQVATAGGSSWLLALPTPFKYRDRVIAELLLSGDNGRWSKFNARYVEAHGVMERAPIAGSQLRAALRVDGMREIDPQGTVRKSVSTSFTQRVAIVLWVLPRTIRWRDEQGKSTGVGPAIVYTMNNHGESALTLTFESQDYVCYSVEPIKGDAPAWHYARQFQEPRDRQIMTLPPFVREVATIPPDAAPEPGRYRVRAGFCGFTEYQLETEIEVVR